MRTLPPEEYRELVRDLDSVGVTSDTGMEWDEVPATLADGTVVHPGTLLHAPTGGGKYLPRTHPAYCVSLYRGMQRNPGDAAYILLTSHLFDSNGFHLARAEWLSREDERIKAIRKEALPPLALKPRRRILL